MSRRQLLVGVVLAACMAAPGAAAAQTTSVSQDELADLTTRARIDPAALEKLRSVEEVDGARVDLEGALEGADRSEIGSRLDALAGNAGVVAPGGDVGAGASAGAAEEARTILSERRFQPPTVPRPLAGLFRWLGRPLQPVLRALQRAFNAIASHLPGRGATLWVIIGGLVVLASGFVAARLVRRSGGRTPPTAAREHGAAGADPRALERLAEEAATTGDHERAVRLRFRAGLLRLDDAKVIAFRPSITSGEVARQARSPTFDGLAASFDAIVYGGRPAAPGDAEAARRGWPLVRQEAAEGRHGGVA